MTQTLWAVVGVFSVLMFFFGVAFFVLMLRQKRKIGAMVTLIIVLLSYFLFQEAAFDLEAAKIAGIPDSLPTVLYSDWNVFLTLVIAISETIVFVSILTHRKRITPMSIKEATDSLPMGILCCTPDGKILLVNTVMERFHELLTGDMLADGALFSDKLRTRTFHPACGVIYEKEELVIRVSDDSVWTVSEETIPYEGINASAYMVSDITDLYQKTIELRRIKEQTEAANAKLVKINQEILALTAEQELLAAKVKIHDELGSNLLSIKQFILHGGEEAEKAEIMQRIRENLEFLKDKSDVITDEYELMISTAKRLGVDVIISGILPQTEPLKNIIATGIHECFTNVLRHAHGNRLYVCIKENGERLTVKFTNNGEPPMEEISEKGGLVMLRSLTERAGGRMTVCSSPALSITLDLPQEVLYAI